MGATEIVQALVSPAEKLIEAVSGAIGKAYEPKHVRKMADAKAYELKLISDTVRNNSDVPIVYDSTGVSINTSNFEEIAKRASSRLAYQEITKQQNIEAVADNAYEELESAQNVSSEPVNPDWMFRFFNSVENISNEDMQKIWGRILAGEIKSPNTYSYRTLEKLKNMTQQEAECFQIVSTLALRHGGKDFLLNDENILKKYKVYFGHILMLEECGLMIAQTLSLNLSASIDQSDYLYNSEVIGLISGKTTESQKVVIPVYLFTKSGSQLIKAIQSQVNLQYFIDCLELIRENHKDFVVTAHTINYISDDGEVNFNEVNILSSEIVSDK
ncbi:MAG: DUF2806 domain-containing protein [Eubacterium sp.]|nr:DUF2806 domain-containing protein [Eubacterium sp.]